jgi:hypothetical protein
MEGIYSFFNEKKDYMYPNTSEQIDEFYNRIEEIRGLSGLDSYYLPYRLDRVLQNKNYWIRKFAVEAIIAFDREVLVKLANCCVLATLDSITEALSDSSDQKAADSLKIIAQTTRDWKIQTLALRALNKIDKRSSGKNKANDNIVRIEAPRSGRFLEIIPSKQSPLVYFDIEKGFLLIKGRVADEEEKIMNIFKSVSDELDLFYARQVDNQFLVELCIEYYRTGCGKLILDFFKRLEKKKNTSVFWYYFEGDNDMQDSGEDFESIIRVPFRLKEISSGEDFFFDFTEKKYSS